jgi:probable HAF family extracellular repeat protein
LGLHSIALAAKGDIMDFHFAAHRIGPPLAASLLMATAVSAHQQYRVVVLPIDGGTDSYYAGYLNFAPLTATGIAGVAADTSTPGYNSYTWAAGKQTNLQPLPPTSDWSGTATYINRINLWGLSAGFATQTDSITGASADNAVVWSPGGELIEIKPKDAAQGHAVWVNDFGQVSGWVQNTTADPCSFGNGAQTEGFIWQFGFTQRLGTLGGTNSYGEFINNLGQVTGHSQTSNTANSVTGCPPFDPFIWQNGKMLDINPGNFGGAEGGTNYLNNHGQAVGFGTTAGEVSFDPFLWQDGVLTNLNTIGNLGGAGSSAFNLNELGHVIGVNIDTAGDLHVVLWRDHGITDLSTLSGYDCSYPGNINDSDQIVGYAFSCETGAAHAFLWENGEMVDLNTLIASDSGIEVQYAGWINDDGVIEAQGVLTAGSNAGFSRAVLLIPDGPCDPNVQAARALALKSPVTTALSARGALFGGQGGRVNRIFLRPVSPVVLRSAIQNQQ